METKSSLRFYYCRFTVANSRAWRELLLLC